MAFAAEDTQLVCAILSANEIGRFLHDMRQIFCWPILLADKIGQLYRSSDTPFSRKTTKGGSCITVLAECCMWTVLH